MTTSFKWITGSLLTLGVLALFLGDKPTISGGFLSSSEGISFSEFDEIIQAPVAHISAIELAEYLMKQEHHYNLIDLQGDEASYRIPTAEPLTIEEFLLKKVPVNETIFLYSENETTATQLYYLLLIRGYFKVKILTGGIDHWYQQILQPNLQSIPIDERSRRRGLMEFFGGSLGENNKQFIPKLIHLEKKIKVHQGC